MTSQRTVTTGDLESITEAFHSRATLELDGNHSFSPRAAISVKSVTEGSRSTTAMFWLGPQGSLIATQVPHGPVNQPRYTLQLGPGGATWPTLLKASSLPTTPPQDFEELTTSVPKRALRPEKWAYDKATIPEGPALVAEALRGHPSITQALEHACLRTVSTQWIGADGPRSASASWIHAGEHLLLADSSGSERSDERTMRAVTGDIIWVRLTSIWPPPADIVTWIEPHQEKSQPATSWMFDSQANRPADEA